MIRLSNRAHVIWVQELRVNQNRSMTDVARHCHVGVNWEGLSREGWDGKQSYILVK